MMSYLGRFGLVVLVLLAGGCQRSADDLIESARVQFERGDVSGAIGELRRAVGVSPKNGESRLLLAHMYAQAGDGLDAEKEFRRALELGISPDRVLAPLARVLNEMQQFSVVLDELAAPADLGTHALAELTLQKARAHLALGALREAETLFRLTSGYLKDESRLGLAQVAIAEADAATGAKLVDEVIADSPEMVDAWLIRGDLLRLGGDPAQASLAYQRAMKLDSRSVVALISEATLRIQGNELAAGRELIERAQRLAPGSAIVNFSRAVLALLEGRHAECREALDRVLNLIPRHAPATLLKAVVLSLSGDLEQAQRVMSVYLGRYPWDLHARKLLAAILLRQRQPERAASVLAPVIEKAEPDAELMSLAGRAGLETGHLNRGLEYLDRAVALAPDSMRFRVERGLGRLAAGDEQRGLADLADAARLGSDQIQADLFLIAALLARADASAARDAADALDARHPGRPVVRQLKGAILLAMNDSAAARAEFERALQLEPGYFPALGALARLDAAQGNLPGARARIEAFLARNPSNLEANLAMAEVEAASGREPDAMARLGRMHDLHPRASVALLELAKLQLRTRRFDVALTSAQRALALDAGDPEVFETLARAELANGDAAAAAATLTRLVMRYPRTASPLLLLAEAHFSGGDARRAESVLQAALRLEPDSLVAGRALGVLLLETGQAQKAEAWAHEFQRRHPRLPHGHALEGDALAAMGRQAKAADAFERASAIDASGPLAAKLHAARTAAEGKFASDSDLLKWLKDHPDDAATRRYLAYAYLSAGKNRDASAQYEVLLKSKPRDPVVLNNLAWALQKSGDTRALEFAQQAFAEHPANPAAADTLGWILLQQGKYAQGLRMFGHALENAPDHPAVLFHRAQALQALGRTADARQDLTRALRSGTKFEHADEARAMLGRLGS